MGLPAGIVKLGSAMAIRRICNDMSTEKGDAQARHLGARAPVNLTKTVRVFVYLAPRAGLEPATLRLRQLHSFRCSPDYLITLRLVVPKHGTPHSGCRALVGLIGENPHPLVSARSPLPAFSSRGFAQGCHVLLALDLGFPEFTRFFNPDYSGKLLFLREPPGDNWRKEARTCQFQL